MNDDYSKSLLDQLVQARLPEMLAGGGNLSKEVERLIDQQRQLERDFDRFSTETGLRLTSLETGQGADVAKLEEFRREFSEGLANLQQEARETVDSAIRARGALQATLEAADAGLHSAFVDMLSKALDARDKEIKRGVEANAKRLQQHSDKFAPVTEAQAGLKWAKRYWLWISGAIVGIAGAVVVISKALEALGG